MKHRMLLLITLLALLAGAAARASSAAVTRAGPLGGVGGRIYLPLVARSVDPFAHVVDTTILPSQAALPGLSGGAPRPVAVMIGPEGERSEFVSNEIVFYPASQQQLGAFLAKYGGTVLRDGAPPVIPDAAMAATAGASSSGWYLIRVDPQRSATSDLDANMQAIGVGGTFAFSSAEAVRLAALVAREANQSVLPNILLTGDTEEHPDGKGGYLDAATWWWMSEDEDPALPGDQGLSVGVVHAWDYLRYMGLPPSAGSWRPAKIAIIDGGFDLDEQTGYPLNGNTDYFYYTNPPPQIDVIGHDYRAGGTNQMKCSGGSACPWHGQEVFGVAAAVPGNRYGSAGTGGEVVRPLLIRIDRSLYSMVDAIRAAHFSGADVINISSGGGCGSWDWACKVPSGEGNIYQFMQNEILFATANGVVIVASAGNDGKSIDAGSDPIPCKLKGVICVGSVRRDKMNDDNYGSPVDIWAPTGIRTTVTRESAALDGNSVGEDELAEFWGTSAAAPFVAGIAGLMKALDPSLSSQQVQQILQDTANASPDPHVGHGYVDAYRAVQRVRPNRPPAVTIASPADAAEVSWGYGVDLRATVVDPETPASFGGTVTFFSDRDGELCAASGYGGSFRCTSPRLTLGHHTIAVRARDPFDAEGSASVEIDVVDHAPTVAITSPSEGATLYANQQANLRAVVDDEDEYIPDTKVAWSSDRDGPLAQGRNASVRLSQGYHYLTVRATDAHGLYAEDQIAVDVLLGPGLPTAHILSPADGSVFDPGTVIAFQGEGTDPEDGTLPDGRLEWFSDRDGFLGSGSLIQVVLSPPIPYGNRVHRITLRVTDSDGNVDTHEIAVNIRLIE